MKPLRVALVGENIGYSRSPEIFGAMFRILGLDVRFDVHSVSNHQLEKCIGKLRKDECSGFSVTVPHKQTILKLVDVLDASAQAVGAVNSVAVRNERMTGFNTDCDGFSFSLRRLGFTGCRKALILGSGGAARAVVYALRRDFGLTRFVVMGRNPDSLLLLASQFNSFDQSLEITIGTDLTDPHVAEAGCDLVVNCTPVGGPNHEREAISPTGLAWRKVALYYDLNYNAGNRMLAEARSGGTVTVDGSAMLVAQAVRSLELWTDSRVDFDEVYGTVFPGR
jgi:shikimate dehydrogenase